MSESTAEPSVRDPRRSPCYPQRVHIREKAQWAAVLAEWDAKISVVRSKVMKTPDFQRTLAQISGARDQIADAVRRLPMEVGEMYAEDKHKLEEAVASLQRIMAKL